jgi:hypothetical protein
MKEIAIPMLNKIESLNQEAEQIKKDIRVRKSATRKSLTDLYEMMKDEISAEEAQTEKAAEEPVPVI